ncbi:putative lipoprotein [Afipia carboxidovorans OM5]|uniref:Transmembrane protein n=1 Tax=Afipia carboxidovorans (strain ATCC 49405 / DSM 1227 / KCTC 32145 / OM5) TaxID=504832 RepID=B6JFX3_AFIC5|nr:hypothetical protein [Afipia carboxidovorans]ACI93396.1 putative lipoprotein [Afipia carboxidovorans OM5]AEI02888.1 hypothetical protein OCA4_c17500 [Afipia carboxidovorans OM4]AEI06464.1 hypothetical protein OCA5_c17500 [Afipia carboxidovorans OM5]BEV47267.1 hypothetical protein CRBSH125_34500 [Afipia carboxidovorans]
MKLLGVILLAGIASLVVGVIFAAAWPFLVACKGAGCAATFQQKLVLVAIFAAVAMAVFSFAATRVKKREAISSVLRLLVLAPAVLIVAGLAADAAPGAEKKFVVTDALQLAVPFWAVVLTQYALIRRTLLPREAVRS